MARRLLLVLFPLMAVVFADAALAQSGIEEQTAATSRGDAASRDAIAPGGDAAAEQDSESEDAAGLEPEPKHPLKGDVVVFKRGSELRGVKVVRQSPMFVEIEYLPGEPYLKIPKAQVSEVIYEQKEEPGNNAGDGLTLGPDIMPGEEVSAEFNHQLTSVVSDTPLEYKDEDYLEVIRSLCGKTGIVVDVDANLEALSPEARKFSYTVPAGTTMLDFLRRDLAGIATDLRVILHYDRLMLQKRMAMPDLPPELPLPDAPPAGIPAEAPETLPEPAAEGTPAIPAEAQ